MELFGKDPRGSINTWGLESPKGAGAAVSLYCDRTGSLSGKGGQEGDGLALMSGDKQGDSQPNPPPLA